MKKQKVVIIGASGHSKVAIDIFEQQGRYEVLGLLDLNIKKGTLIMGYEVLGNETVLSSLLSMHKGLNVFVAIGDNWIRHKVVSKLLEKISEIEFATGIHPSAILGKDVVIGKGSLIMSGAIINPNTQIGDFVILNTKASVDHDSFIGDYTSLAPGVTTGGNVKIDAFSAIGIGATLLHGIEIGKHAVIGAGALVNKNCTDYQVCYGVPAKAIRNRVVGERYL